MTATADSNSQTQTQTQTLRRLIDCCREAHLGFRTAAETVGDVTLKTLFGLYAQQRCRFANELRGLTNSECTADGNFASASNSAYSSQAEALNDRIQKERMTLALYRQAVNERTLPTRTRFLVAAQLALLERVRNRIEAIESHPLITQNKNSEMELYESFE